MCQQSVCQHDNSHNLNLSNIRHSLAHVLAQAVLERFPDGKLAIGPAIEDGFYYDFDLPRSLTPEDLAAIEAAASRGRELFAQVPCTAISMDFRRSKPYDRSRRLGYSLAAAVGFIR